MQDKKENGTGRSEVDLLELARAILSRWYLIVAVAAIAALGTFLVTKLAIKPTYDASTSVIVVNQSDSETKVTYTDTQLGLQVKRDFNDIVKSRSVLQGAIDTLGLTDKLSVSVLRSRITISGSDNTRSVTITVTDPDPERAAKLANAVRIEAKEKTEEIFGKGSLGTIDSAIVPTSPARPRVFRSTVIGALIGALLVVTVLAIIFLTDNTIKDVEDIERHLGLSTLASIPVFEDGQNQTNRFRRNKTAVKKI